MIADSVMECILRLAEGLSPGQKPYLRMNYSGVQWVGMMREPQSCHSRESGNPEIGR